MADCYFAKKERRENAVKDELSEINAPPEEGDLYKRITTFGKTFELRYGYYDDIDRQSPLCEPAVIYPDFQKEPLFTEDGEPFVTVMQDACEYYKGKQKRTPDTNCAECSCFEAGEEWFGICKSPKRTASQKTIYNINDK